MARDVVWTQWDDLRLPASITALSPASAPLADGDLSAVTFYMTPYMGGRAALEASLRMPNLRVLQVPNAGYEDALEFVRPGVTLCNARGVHDASTAELAVALAIASRRGLADFASAQHAGEWRHERFASFADARVGIVGAGSIARSIARRLEPFETEVLLFSRSARDGARAITDLDAVLPSLDVVILALPLNEESRGLMDARRLALLKDGATLVNVARGEIVDTEALVRELQSGRLFAGLDVTHPEPLPSGHPLWSAPNCIITPHVGGDSTAFERRGRALAEEQVARFVDGAPLLNVVAVGA